MKGAIRYTSHAGLLVAVFAAILVLAYLITLNHDRAWDLTAAAENTLDAETVAVVAALDCDVMIRVFETRAQAGPAEDLLELYRLQSAHIRYEVVDPDANPGRARESGVTNYGQAVLTAHERRIVIDEVSEANMTNALLKLSRERQKVVCFVGGHGECALEGSGKDGLSSLATVLRGDNHEVRPLLLLREGAVPQDADLVVIAGPHSEFFPAEIAALRAFLDEGGSVMLALEPQTSTGLAALAADYGMALPDDIIIDTFSRMFGGDYTIPLVVSYGDVGPLKGFSLATFFPTARSLSPAGDLPEDVSLQWLARTSEDSWSERDVAQWQREGHAALDPGDVAGPLNVAMLGTRQASGRLMVFGDADFLTDTYLMVSGNRDLARNCINLLLDEGALIVIEPRTPAGRPFIMTPGQARLAFWIPVVVVPGLILLVAALVFRARRRA